MKYLSRAKEIRFGDDYRADYNDDNILNALFSCLTTLCGAKDFATEFYYEGNLIAVSKAGGEMFGDGDYTSWEIVRIKKSFLSENKKRLRTELLDPKIVPEWTWFEDYEDFVNYLLK
jgi:hypothetical protein